MEGWETYSCWISSCHSGFRGTGVSVRKKGHEVCIEEQWSVCAGICVYEGTISATKLCNVLGSVGVLHRMMRYGPQTVGLTIPLQAAA